MLDVSDSGFGEGQSCGLLDKEFESRKVVGRTISTAIRSILVEGTFLWRDSCFNEKLAVSDFEVFGEAESLVESRLTRFSEIGTSTRDLERPEQ